MKNIKRNLLYFSFALYLILLVWIVSFKCNIQNTIFEVLYTYSKLPIEERFLRAFMGISDITQIVLNVIVFVPLGIYMPLLHEKTNLIKGAFMALSISLVFELIQLFTCIGAFMLDDLVTNTLGFVLGYLIFKMLRRVTTDKAINIVNIIIIVVALPIAVYAIYNTVVNFPIYTLDYYLK